MTRTTNEVVIGQIWKRRCELHDDFDTVRICALVFNAGTRPDEYIVRSATLDFGDPIQTTLAGIVEHCDLVEP